MSEQNSMTKTRAAGSTEHSWCRAVPGGTGTTVLALLLSKPLDISLLQNALHKLQNSLPILLSKLRYDTVNSSFAYVIPPASCLRVRPYDRDSTAQILRQLSANHSDDHGNISVSAFQLIAEHEINDNPWASSGEKSGDNSGEKAGDEKSGISGEKSDDKTIGEKSGGKTGGENDDDDVMYASVYALEGGKCAVTLRIHTSVCDRAAALALLRELLELMSGVGEGENEGRIGMELSEKFEVGLAIEDYIPAGKANKPFWARGLDMVGYGLNSLRFANMKFVDTESKRGSQFVKLQLNKEDTDRLLNGCKTKGIKLCGVLAAAGLIATYLSKGLPEDQWEKYAVVTLIDCRSILDPVLSSNFPGFYHSAILNTHDVKGGEDLWDLAKRSYTSFINAKNNNKHFADMADLNFLMCKAIENPGLTPSSSLRTSLISVFEDPVIDTSSTVHQKIGLEDFIGCASVHGVGPSIAIFDSIRDGQLDCVCVYPFPLHTREQMLALIGEMKRILVDW